MIQLFKKNGGHVGLDVGGKSLKFMELGKKKTGGYSVDAYGVAQVPKDVLIDGDIKNPDKLSDTIRNALKHPEYGDIKAHHVIASIPETKSFIRVIQVPKMNGEEAKEAIPWEAEAYIPLPIAQVYLDWIVLGDQDAALITDPRNAEQQTSAMSEYGGDKMTVLITATPREYVDVYVDVLKKAGLAPIALEIESHATARSLIREKNNEGAALIIDMSASRSSLIIYDHGVLQFTSSVPIGGDAFTEAITKELDTDEKKAEKLKIDFGLGESEQQTEIKKALRPVARKLVDEIRNTIRFYEEHSHAHKKISNVILVGSAAKLKHFPSFLNKEIERSETNGEHDLESIPGLIVRVGDPWVNVFSKSETPPLSRDESLSYATAIGLALREEE